MTNDNTVTRPAATIRIFGPDETEAPIVLEIPEIVIPFPAERPEFEHGDNEKAEPQALRIKQGHRPTCEICLGKPMRQETSFIMDHTFEENRAAREKRDALATDKESK